MTAASAEVALRVRLEVLRNDDERACRRLVLRRPAEWPDSEPGQFLMLHLGAEGTPRFDPLLPRPMAIFRSHPDQLEVLYKVVGRGTAILADLRAGEALHVVGPLGRPFVLPRAGETALLVGGGTGIASLYELAARARERGPVRVLLGARGAEELMALADFEALGVDLDVATDDGSAGFRGLVTERLEAALAEPGSYRVYACGPTPMMQRAAEIAEQAGAPCLLSLENRMACGFGICLGCAVRSRGAALHLVCRDGPVFDASQLDLGALP